MGENHNIKISIIVPVYNAGERLTKCLDSLINQTLKEIEIILILDCPTDGSDKICFQYLQNDSRIKIIKNDRNLHIGLTRNKGINAAKGEYIGFCDHDDIADNNMFKTLYTKAKEKNYDLIFSAFQSIENDIVSNVRPDKELLQGDFSKNTLKDLLHSGGISGECPVFTNVHPNIYKREFIVNNNIKFVDTKKIFPEDRAFNILCLLNNPRVSYVDIPFYKHYRYPGTESTTKDFENGDKWLRYVEFIYYYLTKKNLYQTYREDFQVGAKYITLNSLSSIFFGDHDFPHFFKNLNKLHKVDFIHDSFKESKTIKSNYWKRKIFDSFVTTVLKN